LQKLCHQQHENAVADEDFDLSFWHLEGGIHELNATTLIQH
jgi:hypothetical protein